MGKTMQMVGVLAAVATLALGATACDPAPTVTKVANTVDVGCGFGTKKVPTDWFVPSGTPKGLVWLQHGFTEENANFDEFGRKLALDGFLAMATTLPTIDLQGCTVQNIGNNTAFLGNVAAMFSGMGNANSALGKSWSNAAAQANRAGLALPGTLTMVGHSAGDEAVPYVANKLRTSYPSTFAKVRGLVLEDPVTSFIGDNLSVALTGLNTTSLPVYALASPPYSCNSNQSGTVLLEQKLTNRSFHGSLIVSGSHGDIFGGSVPGTVSLTCGTPQANNVTVVQALTQAWLNDQNAGTTNAGAYPGGAAYQALVSAGSIATLP